MFFENNNSCVSFYLRATYHTSDTMLPGPRCFTIFIFIFLCEKAIICLFMSFHSCVWVSTLSTDKCAHTFSIIFFFSSSLFRKSLKNEIAPDVHHCDNVASIWRINHQTNRRKYTRMLMSRQDVRVATCFQPNPK